jgi:hypothetical protein
MTQPLEPSQYATFLNTLPSDQAKERFCENRLDRIGTAPDCVYLGQTPMKSDGLWNLSYLDGAQFSAWAGLRPMTELEYEKVLRGFRVPVPDEAAYCYWGMNFGGGIYNAQPRMRLVAVHEEAGRAFKGTHGSGTPDLPADWPRGDAVGIATRGGWGVQGVGFQDTLRTSDRHMADADAERRAGYGFRAVRTAPAEAAGFTLREKE